ncbi:MAG: RNA polymerase sigma factor [Actinobacteria bacterium]|nr:RNA polymerase sigma factor [Actinomycetota bacterium]
MKERGEKPGKVDETRVAEGPRLIEREAKLEELMREHSARVLAYAMRRGVSHSEAEDVVAEVFLVCWRRLDDVPPLPLPWIFGVARNVLANQRRSRARQQAVLTRVEREVASKLTDPDPPEAQGLGGLGLQALGRLSESDQEALLLVAWDGLTNKEAARVLGCTQGTFGLRIYRARRRLLKQIEQIRTQVESKHAFDDGGAGEP